MIFDYILLSMNEIDLLYPMAFITLINRMSNGRIIFPNMTLSAIDNDGDKNRKSK
jgi:hypothetical protein